MLQKKKAGFGHPPQNVYKKKLQFNPNAFSKQLSFSQSGSLQSAESDFKDALRRFDSATNEVERLSAECELEQARSTLIDDFGYDLQSICNLADGDE